MQTQRKMQSVVCILLLIPFQGSIFRHHIIGRLLSTTSQLCMEVAHRMVTIAAILDAARGKAADVS